jgi:YHS domain-containing protein
MPGCPLQAAGIQLCEKQQAKVMAILAQARKDLMAVLNSEQHAKFAKFTQGSQMSLVPMVFGQKASLTTSDAGCSQSCSSATTVAQTSTSASGEKACCGSCGTKAKTVAEQTTCPVMESPIKKSVFTVYQGKKVYFCCPGCEKTFNKDPEKYAKNLP